MNVLILTNGDYGDYEFCKKDTKQYDYVICADSGMRHARKLNCMPNLIVGDFDSCSVEDLTYYHHLNVSIERYNPVKDQTDTEIAIEKAILRGATHITVYGGIGTRLDHSLGNIHLLYMLLKKGIGACLMNPHNTVCMTDKEMSLEGEIGDIISLIPFAGEAYGVTTEHLGYPLVDATLKVGTSLGISNYMTAKKAVIQVKRGTLLVILAKD